MSPEVWRQWAARCGGRLDGPPAGGHLDLVFDTRTLEARSTAIDAVFLAIRGTWHDGHDHLTEAHAAGIRRFIVAQDPGPQRLPDSDVVVAADPIAAAQACASVWRDAAGVPVLALTGSNGKTVVKEWLAHLLGDGIHRSPRSFNSQIGVPVALFGIRPHHRWALIEVGISHPGEMARLADCVRPDVGCLTHLGDAHLEHFASSEALHLEKVRLFRGCREVVMPGDLAAGRALCGEAGVAVVTWGGMGSGAELQADVLAMPDGATGLRLVWGDEEAVATLPIPGELAVRNALTAALCALRLGEPLPRVAARLAGLTPVDLRMQRLRTPGGTWVISDAYTNDWSALEWALNDLRRLPGDAPRSAIIGPIPGSSGPEATERLLALAASAGLSRLWHITSSPTSSSPSTSTSTSFFPSTETALIALQTDNPFLGHHVLVKGPRADRFERFLDPLLRRGNVTVLELDLEAIATNLSLVRGHLRRVAGLHTGLIAVIKASGYGVGGADLARLLTYHGTEILAVACTEEGVELRQAGIEARILVFNPDPATFGALIAHHLEPELYSPGHAAAFAHAVEELAPQRPWPVHLKVDTGMHRLGFSESDLEGLCTWLQSAGHLVRVETVFSHLASADDPQHDAFTRLQIQRFEAAWTQLRASDPTGQHPLKRHLLNTAGLLRFPEAAFDYVRLGIGLFGIGGTGLPWTWSPAVTFRTSISLVRRVPAGEGVGYGCTDAADHERQIAVLPVGYADGYPRHLSNGRGHVSIRGLLAPVVGRVCMDMTLVDVTHIPHAAAGDEATLFGTSPRIEDVAAAADTIPYELLTRIPARVQRVQRGG